MEQGFKYFAFISYQRKDETWADWLRKKIEYYRLPSNLRKKDSTLPKEIRPIFRDALELAGGVLAEEIRMALLQSKYLIVICSPNSAKSPWVNKEVQTFINFGRQDYIIPFIIEGVPFSNNPETECFPPALRALRDEREILGININELGRDAAAVKVVARMFGLRFDELWLRHVREQRLRRNIIITIAIAVIFGISGIAYWMYLQRQDVLRANWEMMENQARMVAEKSKEEVRKGNTYDAIVAILEMLPEDGSRPFVPELDEAIRVAFDSLHSRRWNLKYLGRNFTRICFSGDEERILGMDDTNIVIYETRTQRIVTEIKVPDSLSNAMAFLSPTNDTLFVLGKQQVLFYLLPDCSSSGQLVYDRQLLDRCMEHCFRWVPYSEDLWISQWKKAVGLPRDAHIINYNPTKHLVLLEQEKEMVDEFDTWYSYELYDCRKQQTFQTIDRYNGAPFSVDNWTFVTSTSFSPDGGKLAMIQCLGKGFVIDLDNGSSMPFDCGNPDCAHYSNWLNYGSNGQLLHSCDFANLTIFDGQTLMPIDSIPANNYGAELNLTGDVCLLGAHVLYLNPPHDSLAVSTCHFQTLSIPVESDYDIDTIVNNRHHLVCSYTKLKYEDLQGEYDSWEQTETNQHISKSIAGFLHNNRYVLIIREGVRGTLYGVDIIDISSGILVYHVEEDVNCAYYDAEQEIMVFGFGDKLFPETAISFPSLDHLIVRCRELTKGMTLSLEARRRLYLNKNK